MRKTSLLLGSLVLAGFLTGCGNAKSEESLIIYSGRDEELIQPILPKLAAAAGVKVEVRYASSAELAAQLLEEGDATDADLFFSQDAGALGALSKADRLASAPTAATSQTLPRFVDANKNWVATSARARVLAYDPKQAANVTKFDSIDDILLPKFKGKIGIAPSNASFQTFVTAYRIAKGEAAAEKFLTKLKALKPVVYEKNSLILEAVNSGEIAIGLINHYYWHQLKAEIGSKATKAKIHYLNSADPGSLINVAGVGILKNSNLTSAAEKAVAFLTSTEAQQFFVDETAEYPVVKGIKTTKHNLLPLNKIKGAAVDLNKLDSLEATLKLLTKVGLT